eukprot:5479385-Karenia_brevis.AAC.1
MEQAGLMFKLDASYAMSLFGPVVAGSKGYDSTAGAINLVDVSYVDDTVFPIITPAVSLLSKLVDLL